MPNLGGKSFRDRSTGGTPILQRSDTGSVNWTTGWVNTDGTTNVADGAKLTFNHNLGTADITAQVYVCDNPAGTGEVSQLGEVIFENSVGNFVSHGAQIQDITSQQLTVSLSYYGYAHWSDGGTASTTDPVTTRGFGSSNGPDNVQKYIKVVATAGAGGGGSGVTLDHFPIVGDVVTGLIIDDRLFMMEFDQSSVANPIIAQYKLPGMELEQIMSPIADGSNAPITPGFTEWPNEGASRMTADWHGSDGTSVDIYYFISARLNKFTYNRSTKQCSADVNVGRHNGASFINGESWGCVGVYPSATTGKPNAILSRIGYDSYTDRRQGPEFAVMTWNGSSYDVQSDFLPDMSPGPHSLANGITFSDSFLELSYLTITQINPWTGRVYFSNDGFINGVEVWQIDPSLRPANGNYCGAFASIGSDSGQQSALGKMSYVGSFKPMIGREAGNATYREGFTTSLDLDTQKPSWFVAGSILASRNIVHGYAAKWVSDII